MFYHREGVTFLWINASERRKSTDGTVAVAIMMQDKGCWIHDRVDVRVMCFCHKNGLINSIHRTGKKETNHWFIRLY